MKTLAIISRKGGVGKTLISLHLAVAAQNAGLETILLDIDPQSSATEWAESREIEDPYVQPVQASQLKKTLNKAKEAGAELVIIDTAPHSESASLAAARISDLILIPCQPAILDVRAIGHSVDIARLAKVEAFAVLNRVPPKGQIIEDSIEAIKTHGLEVCPLTIGQRVAYSYSLISGQTAQEYEPESKATTEITQLYEWMISKIS